MIPLLMHLLAILISSAYAHSFQNIGRLKYYEYITTARIDVYPSSSRLLTKKTIKSNYPDKGDMFLLTLDVFNRTVSIFLQPANVLHHNATYSVLHENGHFAYKELTTKLYSGKVLPSSLHSLNTQLDDDTDNGKNWASFILHEKFFKAKFKRSGDPNTDLPTFEGVFRLGRETFNIERITTYQQHKRDIDISIPQHRHAKMIIHRASDRDVVLQTPENAIKCGADDIAFNSDPAISFKERLNMEEYSPIRRQVSSALFKRIYSGCPTAKKILYVGIMMDCNYIAQYGGEEQAKNQVLKNFLYVSTLYETQFNIQIGIVEIVALPVCGGNEKFNVACSSAYSISTRLSDFSQWRGTRNSDAGVWHLYTTCATGPVIGLAWMNMVCKTQVFTQQSGQTSTYVSGTSVTASASTLSASMEWLVTAHEIGHNFGAKHDCVNDTSSTCDSSRCCSCSSSCVACPQTYIMSPTANVDVEEFSECSQSEICSKSGTLATCLKDPGSETVVSIAQCGNGIVEGNEECDCGGSAACAKSACCDINCKLKSGAVCDDNNDACCKNCQIAPASLNLLCRAKRGECDQQEYCDGKFKHCPNDAFLADGLPCTLNGTDSGNTTLCASGQCTSRNLQCILRGQSDGTNSTNLDSIEGECPAFFKGQCYLICKSDHLGCRKLSGTYLNGTPCGNAGVCIDGMCTDPDHVGQIIQWVVDNPIPTMGIGAAVLVILIICIVQCCKRSTRRKILKARHNEYTEVEVIRSGRTQGQ